MNRNRRPLWILFAALTFGGLAAPPAGRAAEPWETEARLQALEDHVRIERLLIGYGAAPNTRDADMYASLFTPDATYQWLFSRRVVLTDMNTLWEP